MQTQTLLHNIPTGQVFDSLFVVPCSICASSTQHTHDVYPDKPGSDACGATSYTRERVLSTQIVVDIFGSYED